VVLHCPGPLRQPGHRVFPQWEQAQRTYFADLATVRAFENSPDLTLITYNSRGIPCLLERSCEYVGLNGLVALGKGIPWWDVTHKISLVSEYLRSCRPTKYVMCLDGDDVLVIAPPQEALDRYLQAGAEMLFSSTAWDWPPSPECWDFENLVGSASVPAHRHLNSGGYIAATDYLIPRLAEIEEAIASAAHWCHIR
jgi:hypothetical protein